LGNYPQALDRGLVSPRVSPGQPVPRWRSDCTGVPVLRCGGGGM